MTFHIRKYMFIKVKSRNSQSSMIAFDTIKEEFIDIRTPHELIRKDGSCNINWGRKTFLQISGVVLRDNEKNAIRSVDMWMFNNVSNRFTKQRIQHNQVKYNNQ